MAVERRQAGSKRTTSSGRKRRARKPRPGLIQNVQRQVAPRKPVAGPPTPKKLRGPVNQGRARRQQIAINRERNLVGPPSPKKAGPPTPSPEFRKKNLRAQAKRERQRLGISPKVALDNKRSIESLVAELRVTQRATSRKHKIAFGILGSDQKFYDRATGKKLPSTSPRNPDTLVRNLSMLRVDAKKASTAAPVLKVLDQTTRPLHGIAAGTDAALKGKNVLRAAGRGLANKDKTTFSDVLKTAGAPKVVQSTAGFALDVAADPTTYLTLGAGSVAKKAALDAAKQAEKKALAQGLTKEQAQRFGQRAADRVVKKAKAKEHTRGVTVKLAGKEAPGVRRATAKVGRGAKKVTPRPVKKAGGGTRHMAADLNPNIVPDGMTREQYASVREATRTARSTSSRQTHIARQRARAIQKSIGKKNYTLVLDAIEAGNIKSLPLELRQPARFLRDQFKYVRRTELRAGIGVREVGGKKQNTAEIKQRIADLERVADDAARNAAAQKAAGKFKLGQANEVHMHRLAVDARKEADDIRASLRRPKGYVPHVPAKELDENGKPKSGKGSTTVTSPHAKGRKDKRRLADIRETDPGKYVEDPGVAYASRMMEGARASSRATLNRRLADMGRDVKKGEDLDIGGTEAVYHISGSDVRKLDPTKAADERELQDFIHGGWEAQRKAKVAELLAAGKSPEQIARELQKLKTKTHKPGRYVVLNEQAVDRALKTVTPAGERSSIGAAVDKVQGVWKFIATQPNPGFHLRNAAGGIQNAYLATPGHRLIPNLVHSRKALNHLNKEEKAHNVIGKMIDPGDKGLVINGAKVKYADLIKEAEQVGAIRSGFAARELTDLIENKNKVRTGSHFQALKRFANNIEDVTRLATYIEGRKSGLTAEQASAKAARFHFDYSDLTELERRVLRRVMPFYTFSARNIPLQTMSLIQRPGKFAQYQKIREEFAKAFGIDLDKAENESTEPKQRAAPIYVKVNGETVGLSLGPSGLPLTDLSEFPTSSNPAKQADEWMNRAVSMVTPGLKTPLELWANMSFFFRGQIERDSGPLVPAPNWVSQIPAGIRKDLGIVPDYVDKQTGKKTWGWPGKIAYITNVLPGPFNFANRAMTESDRPGQSTGNKVLGYVGIKADRPDPDSVQIQSLYEDRSKVQRQLRAWNQRGVYADNANADYERLSKKDKDLTAEIMRLRTKRGDVIHGGRKSSGGSFAPEVEEKLNKLREQNSSRFSPEIEKKLEALRK